MSTTTIYFFRHGKIDNPKKIYYGRHIEMQLSREGQEEVKQFARSLRSQHIHIDVLYTSPLHRALNTAQILAGILQVPSSNIIELDDLTDVYIPTLVGKPLSLREEIHRGGMDEYSVKYVKVGHESRSSIAHRMYAVVNKILKEQQGKTIGIVSHGDSLRFLLFRLLCKRGGIPSMDILKAIYYPSKGGGWQMSFDTKGNIAEAKQLPNGEDLTIKY